MSISQDFLTNQALQTKYLKDLQARLAPDNHTWRSFKFSNQTPGTVITEGSSNNQGTLNAPYNELLYWISQGIIWVYFRGMDAQQLTGAVTTVPVPDLVLEATTQPIPLPFGIRKDPAITLFVPTTSPAATGCVHVLWF